MKPLPSPSGDSSLGVPEFPEKSCQNNWNPHESCRRSAAAWPFQYPQGRCGWRMISSAAALLV